jgi:hypothetical protein
MSSSQSWTWPLPPELTKTVLTEVKRNADSEAPDYLSLCSAALVCRKWKVRSSPCAMILITELFLQVETEPLLLEHVSIRTWSRMAACTAQFLSSHFLQRQPAGHMVHDFDIDFPFHQANNEPDTSEKSSALVSLIMLMPRLRKCTIQNLIVIHSELVCIAMSAGSTLTYLEIHISPTCDGTFLIINSLLRLKQLWLTFEDGPWSHSTSHPLVLNTLTHLGWVCLEEGNNEQMVAFLAECSIGPEAIFQIDLPGLQPEIAALVRPFFARNQLKELNIDMLPSSMLVIASDILRIPRVEFHSTMPHPSLLDAPLLPQILRFQYPGDFDDLDDPEDEQNEERFWSVLDRLGASSPNGSATAVVRIWDNKPNVDFDWLEDTNPRRHSAFVGRLMKVAVSLHKRGITVIDRRGRNVTNFAS